MINMKLKKLILFLIILFFANSSYSIEKSCEFPELIKDSFKTTPSSTINDLDIPDSKPRVFYNYPESNLGFVNEKLENTSNVDYNYKKVSNWIDTVLSEMFDQQIEYSFFR